MDVAVIPFCSFLLVPRLVLLLSALPLLEIDSRQVVEQVMLAPSVTIR